MDQAVAAGAYSLTCEPAAEVALTCSPIRDEDVMPALRREEAVYGRTVIAFPGGADVDEDSGPTFEATDLVCADATGPEATCLPVTAAAPTVRAGADVFVFYSRHNVTLEEDGQAVSHLDAPTVPLRGLPAT